MKVWKCKQEFGDLVIAPIGWMHWLKCKVISVFHAFWRLATELVAAWRVATRPATRYRP
jgi:hypothetical protein